MDKLYFRSIWALCLADIKMLLYKINIDIRVYFNKVIETDKIWYNKSNFIFFIINPFIKIMMYKINDN